MECITWEELDRRHTINLYNAYHPDNRRDNMNRIELREKLAQAYCAKEDEFKVLDPVLIESMVDQILGREDNQIRKDNLHA